MLYPLRLPFLRPALLAKVQLQRGYGSFLTVIPIFNFSGLFRLWKNVLR
jgi:hypothetical protein